MMESIYQEVSQFTRSPPILLTIPFSNLQCSRSIHLRSFPTRSIDLLHSWFPWAFPSSPPLQACLVQRQPTEQNRSSLVMPRAHFINTRVHGLSRYQNSNQFHCEVAGSTWSCSCDNPGSCESTCYYKRHRNASISHFSMCLYMSPSHAVNREYKWLEGSNHCSPAYISTALFISIERVHNTVSTGNQDTNSEKKIN